MGDGRRRRVLDIVRTDATFEPMVQRGQRVFCGRCIHCRSKVTVSESGELFGKATIEHIVPRHHGGTDELGNLALACARCNHAKGRRLDHRRLSDPTLRAVVERLQERRRKRWREHLPKP